METINNFENQNLVQPVPQIPQKNTFKILFFVLLGLFLIILLIIISLLINIKKTISQPQNQTTENISIIPTITSEPVSIITDNTTQDWKTYTDKILGFSLKYPNYVELINSNENPYDMHKPIIQFKVRKISEIYDEPEMVDYVIKEKTDLENGLIGKNLTPLDNSNNPWNILKIDNSIYGRITSVFQLHEVCSFMMKRHLVFYSNEYRIDVFYDYYGSQPLVPDEYMTVRKDICYTDSKIWKDNGAKSFYDTISTNTLKNETLQNWFNDFDKIVKTIKF